jgi:hypothetical protein
MSSQNQHAELCEMQNVRTSKAANRAFRTLRFVRPSGRPMTGVDITYLGCFRSRGRSAGRVS